MSRNLKKSLAIMLSILMMVSSVPLSGFVGIDMSGWFDVFEASAEEIVQVSDSGECGENLTWTFENGVLTISGTGAMTDYSYNNNRPWDDYEDDILTVIIEDSVTSIGDRAFYWYTSLTSITIPDSVTSIGDSTFYGCTSLTSITIPDSVTSIGEGTFNGCTSLTSITIPDSVTSIGSNAFRSCTSLTSITIPDSVTSIGYSTFESCTSLTSITIPDSVTSIGGNAFRSCTSLTSITIPDSVTSIGESTFNGCTSLTSITIPDSVTSIGNYAFRSCTSLTSITIPDLVTSIGSYAFESCKSLTSITIPDSVTSIESYAFESCKSLTSITIPDSVTSIGSYAFRYCASLTSVTIPDSVTRIGSSAFMFCASLTTIYFQGTQDQWNSISIGSNLTYAEIIFLGSEEETTEIIASGECGENLTWTIDSDYTLTISGAGAMNDYSYDNNLHPWEDYEDDILTVIIEDSVTSIGSYAFSNCTNLTSITIPDSVTSIGSYSFAACENLTSITTPDSVTSIGEYAFASCTRLASITIPDLVTSIGEGAFASCASLTSITIPDSVTSIGGYAFYGCESLMSITIPDSVTSIGSYSFVVCTNLTSITIPDSVTSIGEGVFVLCTSLTSITIPDSVTSIGEDAFVSCTSLTSIIIPDSVTSIGDSAFDYCTSLTSITIPDSVTSIGDRAFAGCESLTSITIPDSVTSIGKYAFEDCSNLTSITIPDSVTSIGDYVFSNCYKLKSVTIPDSVTSIGSYAFYDCENLTTVYFQGTQAQWNSIRIDSNNTDLTNAEIIFLIEEPTSGQCGENLTWELKDGVLTITGTGDMTDYDSHSPWGYNTEITKVIIEDGVTTIGDRAFVECTNLTEVVLADSITSIGSYAFLDCEKLGEVELPENLVKIKNSAFENCVGLTSIVIPEGCTSIGSKAFKNCVNLETVSIPVSVVSIGYYAFGYCSNIETVNYGGSRATWNKIYINSSGNGYLTNNANIIFAIDHEFGNWAVVKEATVFEEGLETRTCALCGDVEEKVIEKLTVDEDNEDYGTANFTIVDATTLVALENVSIIITNDVDGEIILTTDENGKASQVMHVGTNYISVYLDGYNIRNVEYNIVFGTNEVPTIGISTESLVSGEVTSKEMTKEEIIEAGLDLEEPGNYNVVKYEATIQFQILNDTGTVSVPVSVVYYDGAKNDATVTHIDEQIVTIYPVSENFYLITYGEAIWLKEMYEVQLLAINNSYTDYLTDVEAELELPDGLSLASMTNDEQTLVQEIGEVGYGESTTVKWYVRGDAEGVYDISTKLTGTMMPFGDEFEYTFTSSKPLTVYSGSALQLNFLFPETVYDGEDYTVTVELENVSSKTLYNVSHVITGYKQIKVTRFSNSEVMYEASDVVDTDYLVSVDEFEPGDKIVIEMVTDVAFDSLFVETTLLELTEDYPELYEYYSYAKNAVDSFATTQNFFILMQSALKNLSNTATDDMLTAVNEFLVAVESAQAKLDSVTNLSLETVELLKYCSAYVSMNGLSQALIEDELSSMTVEEIQAMTDELAVLASYNGSLNFGSFESLEFIASTLPIVAIFKNFIFNTLEGSTTEIPYTYTLASDSNQYTNVNNISSYIYDLTVDAFGEKEIVNVLKHLGYNANTTEFGGTYEYDSTTVGKTEYYLVDAATKESVYTAWISDSDCLSVSTTGDYDRNSDGSIAFIGDAIVEVDANSVGSGILNIKDENGNVAQYEIEVVGAHVCNSTSWKIELSGDSGYKVKYCDVCGEIIDIQPLEECSIHSYGEAVILAEATAITDGLQAYICETCGHIKYEVIPATGVKDPCEEGNHSYEAVVTAPTCTEDGYTTYTCSACGDTYTADETDALGHSYEAVVTAPTCTEDGYTTYTCSVCGDTYTADETDATGHSYEAVVTAPTCTEDGYTTYTCSVCGDTYTADETDATGHIKYVSKEAVAATLTTVGYTEEISCSVCGKVLVESVEIPKIVLDYTCGENLTWSFADGVLTISGNGDMYDWTKTSYTQNEDGTIATVTMGTPWDYYKYDITSVVIEDGVTNIGQFAFGYCTSLTSITIPDSVETINAAAFGYCSSLETIEIPDSVTSIGSEAFVYCTSLANVTLADSIKSIGSYAFIYCFSLESIDLPSELTEISVCMFVACVALKEIEIPETVTSIGEGAFANCIKLETITTYTALETIVKDAFANCVALKTLYYQGAQEQWTEVDVAYYNTDGTLCNEALQNVTIVFNPCYAGHTEYVSKEAVAPTCTEKGSTAEISCSVCGEIITESEEIDATGHNYEAVVIAPTCIEGGYTTYTCSVCGDTYTADETDALGHSYEAVVTAPTCTEGGYTTYTCSVCGDTYTADETDPTGHTEYVSKEAVAPTYTSVGYTEEISCSVCGEVLVASEEIPMLDPVITSGECGDNVTYKIVTDGETNVLIIDGTGSMYNYKLPSTGITTYSLLPMIRLQSINYLSNTPSAINEIATEEVPWAAYLGDIDQIIIKSGVTIIGENSFNGCIKVTSVTIAQSVEEIRENAFEECNSLETINYTGSEEQWTALTEENVVETGNDVLLSEETQVVSCENHTASGCLTITKIVAPTCVEQGYTVYTCTCGEEIISDYVDATGVHTDENGDGYCDNCEIELIDDDVEIPLIECAQYIVNILNLIKEILLIIADFISSIQSVV